MAPMRSSDKGRKGLVGFDQRSSDKGRKGLALALGFDQGGRRRRRMEEEEIEEGELIPDEEEIVAEDQIKFMDPSVRSFIDDKLERLLGPLRASFRRGLSARNLVGPKFFGEYGSFLQGGLSSASSLEASTPIQGAGKGLIDSGEKIKEKSRLPMLNRQSVRKGLTLVVERMEEKNIGDGEAVRGQDEKSSMDHTDELYNVKKEYPCASPDVATESPSTILQIMTSLPLSGGHLLSPLPESLLQLKRREHSKNIPVPFDGSSEGNRDHSYEFENASLESPNTILEVMTAFQLPEGHLLSPLPESLLQLKRREHSEDTPLPFVESCNGNRNHTCESEDAPLESPNTILQMMTSFPIAGGIMLSPLPESVLQLNKKEPSENSSMPQKFRYAPINHSMYNAAKSVASCAINETWVACDVCDEWRLLPYGTDRLQFEGNKWRCSMQTWLAGLNKCHIPEPETTKALNALYHCFHPRNAQVKEKHKFNAQCSTSGHNNGKYFKSNRKRKGDHDDLGSSKKSRKEGTVGIWHFKSCSNGRLPPPSKSMKVAFGRGISQEIPPPKFQEKNLQGGRMIPKLVKQKNSCGCPINTSKEYKKSDVQHCPRQDTPNLQDSSISMRKDGKIDATIAFDEGRRLKHVADGLKDERLKLERTDLYFEAALKFLNAASLLELPSFGSVKHGDSIQSAQMYSDTAKLFELCANEYERCQQMSAAAVAYKCEEVSFMKAAYLKHPNASKDRYELENAIRRNAIAPDVCPDFMRLFSFMNEMNCAFEATRKLKNAFAAALLNDQDRRICSVKEVIRFNFQNVEGFLKLLRPSMEIIRG